jgi:hypothetical protein
MTKDAPPMKQAPAGARYETTPARVVPDDSGNRAAQVLEWAIIGALVLIYAASFGIDSPVNGLGKVYEVFDQDSRYIIKALAGNVPYEWNAQNHIFYHWLTDKGFHLWQRGFGGGLASAYLFLKLFTAATGLCFLVTLRVFLREVGVGVVHRLAMLPLAGLSVAVWFHFSGFETSGLTMPFFVLFLIAFLRRVRRRDESLANHAMLVGSLLFAFWTRSDQWRLPVAAGFTLFLPQTRGLRRGLVLDLLLFGVLLPVGFALLASSYFHLPLAQAVRKVSERHDRAELAPMLANRGNLAPRNLLRVARANAVYSFIMPIANHPSPFSGKLTGLLHSPLSISALLGVVSLLVVTAARSLRRLVSGDAFHLVLWSAWIMGWLFYTWFNPYEPFLWILQFGVLEIAALADTWPSRRTASTIAPLVIVVALVVLHNTVFFWFNYR